MDSILGSVGVNASPAVLITSLIVCLFPVIALFGLALSQREAALPPPACCRKLGIQGASNLQDQHSKRYARGGTRTPANPWTVKAIFIYPIKSCAPVELDNTKVLRTGLKYDRQYTFAQLVTGLPSLEGKVNSEWQFMTLRKFPRLAKIETEVWVPDPSLPGYSEDAEWVKSEGCLIVRFPFSPDTDFTFEGLKNYGKILAAKLSNRTEPMIEFRLPFNPPKDRIERKGCRSQELKIWKDSPQALDLSPEIDPEILAKLKYTLGTSNPVTLFRIDPERPREVTKMLPPKADLGFQPTIGMHDSYPVHILNLASVHDIASKLPRQEGRYNLVVPLLNALRFRANIYLTGPPAFHEDGWTKARISSPASSSPDHLDMYVSCRTSRCKLPNVDPEIAIADRNEPYATLRKYRIVDEGDKNPSLGMQVLPLQGGEVRVGDYIEVL